MAPYTFQLDFRAGDRTKGQLPFAGAQITLQHWSRNENDIPIVSPHCMGEVELEAAVRRLKGELDEILTTGRRKFAAHRREIVGGASAWVPAGLRLHVGR